MAWVSVSIGEEQLGRNLPAVSIGHKRLSLNIAACDLIDQKNEHFTHVQFYQDNKNPKRIAMRFWKKPANDYCVPLSQKMNNGKAVGGLDVVNARLMQTLFGEIANNTTVTKYRVHLDDTDKYLLVIDAR